MASPGALRDATVKPEWGAQIDNSHLLAQGLVFASAFLESGDLRTENIVDPSAGGALNSGVSWGGSSRGSSPIFNGTSGAISYSAQGKTIGRLSGAAALSISAWINTATLAGQSGGVNGAAGLRNAFYLGDRSYNSSAEVLELRYYTTPSPHLEVATGGGSFYSAGTAANSVIINTWYHIVGVYVNSTLYIYVNGVLAGSAAAGATTGSISGSTVMQIGTADYSIGAAGDIRYWQGFIDNVMIWARALSWGEVGSLYTHPYGLFLPSNMRRFFTGSGQALSKLLSEALTFTDTRTFGLTRLAAESLLFSDTRANLLAKVMAETLALVDGRSASVTKRLSDAVALADGLLTTLNGNGQALSKLLSETLGLSDARQINLSKKVSETLNLSDNRVLGIAKQIGEVLGFVDGVQATGVGLAVLTIVTNSGFGDRLVLTGGKA